MIDQKLSENKVKQITHRFKHEDQLLNSRTGIILTFNGLMAVVMCF